MPNLIHLIYASAATTAQTERQLDSILSASRRNNSRDGVTGMLLYSDGSFFQVLEGQADAVDITFERIDRDPRHHQATCIIREPIAMRSFSEWTMGYAAVAEKQLAELAGLNDFYSGGSCLSSLDPGRARKLLTAFSTGRWHSRLRAPAAV